MRAQRHAQFRLKRPRVSIDFFWHLIVGFQWLICYFLCESLDFAHSEALRDNAVGDDVGVGEREQRAGMARRQFACRQQRARMVGQARQAQRIGDMAAALADNAGDVGV